MLSLTELVENRVLGEVHKWLDSSFAKIQDIEVQNTGGSRVIRSATRGYHRGWR